MPESIIEAYYDFIRDKAYPCIEAKAALEKQHVSTMVASHMGCPHDDNRILDFLYGFIDRLRDEEEGYYSAAIFFQAPAIHEEDSFDLLLWERLQALADLDACSYPYDKRVSPDPSSPDFSFSLKEEAFYVIGLHPASVRKARRFSYPGMVFNPHAQFERLRSSSKFEPVKSAIRKRDILYSGSVNPMLDDFGDAPEVLQYSGRHYAEDWRCPLKINHKIKPG